MKHLLNDLSEEEKNRIREQHTGGKKIIIENFKNLTETKSGDVKLYITESDFDKKSFEVKMETTPDENIDSVISILDGLNKDEASAYLLELKNRKPKWLSKLLRRAKKAVKSGVKDLKQELPKALTGLGIYTLVYSIFKDDIDKLVDDEIKLR